MRNIDTFFLGLPIEYQEKIQEEAEKELALSEEVKKKFPEQYRLLRLAKIRNIAARMANEVVKITTSGIELSKSLL